jgi:hypothetical protein
MFSVTYIVSVNRDASLESREVVSITGVVAIWEEVIRDGSHDGREPCAVQSFFGQPFMEIIWIVRETLSEH